MAIASGTGSSRSSILSSSDVGAFATRSLLTARIAQEAVPGFLMSPDRLAWQSASGAIVLALGHTLLFAASFVGLGLPWQLAAASPVVGIWSAFVLLGARRTFASPRDLPVSTAAKLLGVEAAAV